MRPIFGVHTYVLMIKIFRKEKKKIKILIKFKLFTYAYNKTLALMVVY